MQKLHVTPLKLDEGDGDMPTVRQEDDGLRCFDVSENFIVTGSNMGVVSIYDRGQRVLLGKYSNKESIPPSVSTAVAAVCHVAISPDEGRICAVFDTAGVAVVTTSGLSNHNLSMPLHHHTMHGTEVTCIAWAADRIFTGDKGGYVIAMQNTHGDAAVALREECALVQISIKQKTAAVSTLRRTIMVRITDTPAPGVQVGGQLREGVYGGCLAHGFIYASRPRKDFDARIWKAEPESGSVKKTLMFRHVPDVDSERIVVTGCSFDLNGVYDKVGTHDGKAKYKRHDGGATLYSTAGLWAATDSSKKKVLLKTDDHGGSDVTQMTTWQELQPDESYALNKTVKVYDEMYFNNLSLSATDRQELATAHKTNPVPYLGDIEGTTEPLLAAWGDDAVLVLNALSVKVVSMKFLRGLIHVVPMSIDGVPVLYTLHRSVKSDKRVFLSTVWLSEKSASSPTPPTIAERYSPVLKERMRKTIDATAAPPPPSTQAAEPTPEPIVETNEKEPESPKELSEPSGIDNTDNKSPESPSQLEDEDKLIADAAETVMLGGNNTSRQREVTTGEIVTEKKKVKKIVRKKTKKEKPEKIPSVADLLNNPDLSLTPNTFGPETLLEEQHKENEMEKEKEERKEQEETSQSSSPSPSPPPPVEEEKKDDHEEARIEEASPVISEEEKDTSEASPPPPQPAPVQEEEPSRPLPPSPSSIPSPAPPTADPEPDVNVGAESVPAASTPSLSVPEREISVPTVESLARGPDPLAATMADLHLASHKKSQVQQPQVLQAQPQHTDPVADVIADESKDDSDTPVLDEDINGWRVMSPRALGNDELKSFIDTTDQVHIVIRDYKLQTAFDSMASAQRLRAFTAVTDWVDHVLTILDTDLLLQGTPSNNRGTIASPTERGSLQNKMAVLIDAYIAFRSNSSLVYRGREMRPDSEALGCTDDNVVVRLLHFMKKRGLFKEISCDELTANCANLGSNSGNYVSVAYLLQCIIPGDKLQLLKGYLPHPQTQFSNLIADLWSPVKELDLQEMKKSSGVNGAILRRDLNMVQKLEANSDKSFLSLVIYYLPYLFAAGSDQAMKAQKLVVKCFPKISWKIVRAAISRNVQEEAHRVLGITWDTNQHWIEYQELYLDYCRFLAEEYPELCRNDAFVGQYINVLVHTITTLPVYQAYHNSVEEGGSPASPRGGSTAIVQQRDMQSIKLRRLERVLKKIICDTKAYTYNPEEVRSIFIRKKYYSGLLILGKQTPQLMSNIYMQLLQCDQGETLLNYFRDEVGDDEKEWMSLIKTGALLKAEQKGTQQGGAGPLDYVSYLMCVCLGPKRTMELLSKHLGSEVEYEDFYKKLAILVRCPPVGAVGTNKRKK
eukprot:TRINITY_DN11436_c0_g2_i1.p1 TRINITY_DN11436_c0_g2~~TRINITY_DN11436_c0_g2_i1.p1  ORF type:complete len:1375 (+),score=315.32 TRINITY_DN11436_c0_g2_i1:60-4127(+)